VDNPLLAAERTRGVNYAVRDIVLVAREAKKSGKDLIYLNIGDPNQFGFETPPNLIDAICRALRDNKNSYASSEGIPEALEAIRSDAEQRLSIKNIQDVYVGHGCGECIELALAALVNRGEEVLVPHPGYPLYSAVLAKLEAVERPYALLPENQWEPDLDELETLVGPKTRAIIINTPHNPTGAVYSRNILEKLASFAARHNLVVLSDEIYDQLVLDDAEHVSIASLRDDIVTVTFAGLSKVYIGPGLRIGWSITSGPKEQTVDYIAGQHRFLRARLCVNHPVQYAIAPALTGDRSFLEQFKQDVRDRRDLITQALSKLPGVSCEIPRAAFYAFPEFDPTIGGVTENDVEIRQGTGREDSVQKLSDLRWVESLIRKTGVVLVHGSGFGTMPTGRHFFRLVYLPAPDRLLEATNRMQSFMVSG